MTRKFFLIILLLGVGLFSCKKDRRIGGRVFDKYSNEPMEGVNIVISPSSGSSSAFVTTNSSGYYIFNPENDDDAYQIQILINNLPGPNGGNITYPNFRISRPTDGNKEYDFFIERLKRLVVQFLDTNDNFVGKDYVSIHGNLYSKTGATYGRTTKIENNFMDLDSVYTLNSFSSLGWFYATGYVRTSTNTHEPFHDSIFISKPLDGLDTLKVYY